MTEYGKLLDEYASEAYSMYSRTISEREWGNKSQALGYLNKYYLPEQEYLKNCKPIQNRVFKNQDRCLPEMMFNEGFYLLAARGGILFEKQDFENLQRCIKQSGDRKLFIIQNDYGGSLEFPPFRMCYPSDITWEELMSGNFISTIIFEMFANEYFVFGESGQWGKYSANDYEQPLEIIGFKPEYEAVFKENFQLSHEESEEIRSWLPQNYREIIRS